MYVFLIYINNIAHVYILVRNTLISYDYKYWSHIHTQPISQFEYNPSG